MKPGHHSEDDSAGYDVCSDAILGHLKRGGGGERKFMPFSTEESMH